MTMKAIYILQVLVFAGLLLQPVGAAAQIGRSTIPPPPSSRATNPPAPAPTAAAAPAATRPWHEQQYRLGGGDKLRIEVYGEDQLSQSLQIRPDGQITLPLIGDIAAANRTSIELRDVIAAAYKEYITNPVVTVIVQEANAAQIHVIGEVEQPGPQVMQGPLTVLQALAEAGGLKEFANQKNIRILRRTSTGTTTIPFNYKDALRGRIEPVFLEPGDTLVIP